MIDMVTALAAAAEQVHRTHCTVCDTTGECWGFDEVDAGVAVAVLDSFFATTYQQMRKSLWDALHTIKP